MQYNAVPRMKHCKLVTGWSVRCRSTIFNYTLEMPCFVVFFFGGGKLTIQQTKKEKHVQDKSWLILSTRYLTIICSWNKWISSQVTQQQKHLSEAIQKWNCSLCTLCKMIRFGLVFVCVSICVLIGCVLHSSMFSTRADKKNNTDTMQRFIASYRMHIGQQNRVSLVH